jgi:hypothetical protein
MKIVRDTKGIITVDGVKTSHRIPEFINTILRLKHQIDAPLGVELCSWREGLITLKIIGLPRTTGSFTMESELLEDCYLSTKSEVCMKQIKFINDEIAEKLIPEVKKLQKSIAFNMEVD